MHLKRICRSVALIAALAIALGLPLSGRAPDGWSRADPPALQAPPSDPTLLRLLSTLSPQSHVIAAVAVDIDHDGDLDVIATTRRDLEVWVNQGGGHFTEQRVPVRTAAIAGHDGIDVVRPSTTVAVLPRTFGTGVFATSRSSHLPEGARCRAVPVVVVAPARQLLDPSLGRAPPFSARLA